MEAVLRLDETGLAARRQLLVLAGDGRVQAEVPAALARRLVEERAVAAAVDFLVEALAVVPDAVLEAAGLAVMAGPQAADPGAAARALPALFRRLDALDAPRQETALRHAARALANAPDGTAAWLAALPEPEASPSFLSAVLMSGVMEEQGGIVAPTRRRLEALPDPGYPALTCLAKALLAGNEPERAETVLGPVVGDHPEAHRAAGTLAAIRFALGREAEARQTLRGSLAHLDAAWMTAKRRFNADWRAQLAEALETGAVDGGAADRLGAAATYTAADRWRGFWDAHREECGPENRFRTVAGFTNALMFGTAEAVLDANPGLGTVVNYGTLCGRLEDDLAARRPGLRVAGFDVSPDATALNRQTYRRPNLDFGDDFPALLAALSDRAGGTLMVHCRTFDVMLPGAVRQAYRQCREAGVDAILSAEYFAVCWDTLDWPVFSREGPPTVHWDGVVMIHDLPRYLAEAGYRVLRDTFHPIPLFASGTDEGLQPAQMVRLIVAATDGAGIAAPPWAGA